MRRSRRLLLLVLEVAVYVAASVSVVHAVADKAPAPAQGAPVREGTVSSGTTRESLCVEGYLPDGTYWSCE